MAVYLLIKEQRDRTKTYFQIIMARVSSCICICHVLLSNTLGWVSQAHNIYLSFKRLFLKGGRGLLLSHSTVYKIFLAL